MGRGRREGCVGGAVVRAIPVTHLSSWCVHQELGRERRGPVRAGGPGRLQGPHPVSHRPLLVYVLDVYDPWSYAYLPAVATVLGSAGRGVEVEVVNAGRYAGCRVSTLTAPVAAVQRELPVRFGRGFLRAMHQGSLRVDSRQAAAGIIALLASEEAPISAVLDAVQREFFVHGRPLESPGVLGRVARTLGLDAPAVELFAASDRARELAGEDCALAGDIDGGGGPVLLASHAGRVFEFDGIGASGDRLMDQFRSVLARP